MTNQEIKPLILISTLSTAVDKEASYEKAHTLVG